MEPLDPTIVNFAKALKKTETGDGNTYTAHGKSGEFGAYQFMPDTYKNYAQKYLGDANAQPTVENQNKIAYSFTKEKKAAGFNPAQIASMWNAGEGKPNAYKENYKGVNAQGVAFDTPAYVKRFSDNYNTLKGAQPAPATDVSQETPKPEHEGTFESSPNDSPLEAGAKTLGNIPSSLFNFGKGVLHALNPLNTLKTLSQIPEAFKGAVDANNGVVGAIGNTIGSIPEQTYKGLVPEGVRDVLEGDFQGAQKKFTEDPIGTVAPVVLAGVGGLDALKKGEVARNEATMKDYVKNIGDNVNKPIPEQSKTFQNAADTVDKGISKTAQVVTKPIAGATSGIVNAAKTLGRSVASQLTGMKPETITKILTDPKEFSRIAQEEATRGGLAGEVESAINKRLSDLSETGKGYEGVRAGTKPVQVSPFVKEVIEKNGLKVKGGKIVADTNSVTRNPADIKALQKFYDDWGKKTTLTSNEYLNMRGDIAELSKFDKLTGMGKTRASESIGKALYERANKDVRDTQLPELKALDEKYAPERQFLQQVKKDYFNRDGTFKDNAPAKIANSSNKAQLLSRLEEVVPGITKRIEVLKAVEDIEAAMGNKVGTYTRGFLQGGSILTGNMAGIVATIITHPSNAVRLLRAAGYTANTVGPILSALKLVGGDVKVPTSSGLISAPAAQNTLTP